MRRSLSAIVGHECTDMNFDLRDVLFTPELLACISAEVARRYRVLPVFISPSDVTLAMADPSDLEAIDAIRRLLQRDVTVCIAETSQLDDFIQRLYGSEGRI